MSKNSVTTKNIITNPFYNQQEFSILFENNPDIIAKFDQKLRYIYANPSIEKITGINYIMVVGKTNEELNISPDIKNIWNKNLKKVFKKGNKYKMEFSIITPQGEKFFETHLVPELDEQKRVVSVISVSHDISNIKKLELKKDELMSIASHELKTPITSAKMFVQILRRIFVNKKDKKSNHYLRHIEDQLNRLSKLVNNLLDASRIESNRMKLNKKYFSLKKSIQEVARNIQATSSTHQIILENLPSVKIFADKDRIEQVLINLFINAIKYSPRAHKVIVNLDIKDNQAILSVEDFGIGIDKKYHQKIFNRFYSISQNKKGDSGLGVGLYISSEIIKRHNGKIYIKSKKDHGTIFYFTLPLQE